MATLFLRPTGIGANNTGVTAVGAASVPLAIDEAVSSPDDDTTYAKITAGSGQISFTHGLSLPAGSTGISVKARARGKASSASTSALFIGIYQNSGNGISLVTSPTLTTSYADYVYDMGTTNPVTSVNWVEGDIAALEMMMQVGVNSGEAHITAYELEVTYTPPATSVPVKDYQYFMRNQN